MEYQLLLNMLLWVVDGGWGKQSHKHSCNAKSGVRVIFGAATKKLLFIGVRNKYCSVCAISDHNNLPHPSHAIQVAKYNTDKYMYFNSIESKFAYHHRTAMVAFSVGVLQQSLVLFLTYRYRKKDYFQSMHLHCC